MKLKIALILSFLIVYIVGTEGQELRFEEEISLPEKIEFGWTDNTLAHSDSVLIVGVPNAPWVTESNDTLLRSGRVFVYKRVGNKWNYYQELFPLNHLDQGLFGYSVAIRKNKIVVGAPWEGPYASAYQKGAIYFYVLSDNGYWELKQRITGKEYTNNNNPAYFGWSVDISDSLAVAGAFYEDTDNEDYYLESSGAAYIYNIDTDSDSLRFEARLVSNDRHKNAYFGYSVSCSNTSIVCGAPVDSTWSGSKWVQTGSASIFSKAEDDVWVEQKVYQQGINFSSFGSSVTISDSFAIIGYGRDCFDKNGRDSLPNSGAAYTYKQNMNGVWFYTQKLVHPDRKAQDNFGATVAFNNKYAAICARGHDYDENGADSISDAGAVYIFKQDNDGGFNFYQKIVENKRKANSWFGRMITIDSNFVISSSYDSIFNCFKQCRTYSEQIVESTGDYFWNDSTYTESGNYILNLTNQAGCDSIITLKLTINKSSNLDNKINVLKDIIIYPNPTAERINVNLNEDYSDISLQLFSVDGRMVDSYDYQGISEITYFIKQKKGIYILRLMSNNEIIVQTRIIKN